MSPTASSSRSSRSPNPEPKSSAEGLVLALEPAAADAQDRPARSTAGPAVVASLAVRPGFRNVLAADEQAEPDALGEDGQGRQRRPALELGVARVALVGEQVIVDPERVPARGLDRAAGRQQVRPGRPIDPERRAESHARAQAWIVSRKRKTGIAGSVLVGERVRERRRQDLVVRQVAPEDDVLVAEQVRHRVVRREARRDALEVLVRTRPSRRPPRSPGSSSAARTRSGSSTTARRNASSRAFSGIHIPPPTYISPGWKLK